VNPLPQTVSIANSRNIGNVTPSGQTEPQAIPNHDDVPEDSDIAWSTKDKAPGFPQVHYRLFETITTWTQQEDADKHPFYMKW
jgi:hypothetical protein